MNEDIALKIDTMYKRYLRADNAIAKKKKLWTILDIYDRGEQWADANIPPWIPKPVTNYLRYVRTLKRANLTGNIPKSYASALEQEFEEYVTNLQQAYEHVWEWEKVPGLVRTSVDRALLRGTSIAYTYDDSNYVGGRYTKGKSGNRLYQGKICVKLWPLQNFFPDPDAFCIPDAKYIDTTEVLPLNTVKHIKQFRKYCEKNGTLKKLDALSKQLLEYTDADGTIFKREYEYGNSDASNDKDYMATIHAHWERYLTTEGRYRLDVTYYMRNTDFYLLKLEDVKPSRYPFSAYLDEYEDAQFHGTSTVMEFLENQRVINKTSQTYSIIATMHQNPQKVVTRSSGISAQEVAMVGTLPGKTWTTNDPDSTKSIHWSTPPEIPRGLFEVDNAMKSDIREIAGINEAYTGESVGSLTTSTGVQSLIERASIRDRDKMKQIDAFVEDLSDMIRLLILYKWKDERPIPIKKTDGTLEYNTYKPIDEDIADQLEWLCSCDTYAVAPTTEEKRRRDAMELLDVQGKYGFSPALITPQEFIRMGNYADKDKIMQRMQKDLELMQQQKQAEPPRIIPNGEINYNISSKDPMVVMATLQQALQQQMVVDQNNLQLTAQHMNNGLAVNATQMQQQGMGAPGEQNATAPSGSIDAQSMAAMVQGQ